MQTLLQDLRYGARMLLKKPGFTLVAALTLALGVGANTAIFTVINAALLCPLPYPDSERLVVVATTMRRDTVEVRSTSYLDFVDWRDQNTVFERIAARASNSFTLTGGAGPENVNGELVSADYFPLLRAQAALGRTFLPEEDRAPDTHRVAVVGYGLWQRRFGGAPALVGQTVQLNGADYAVVGVMPDGFRGVSDQSEIWLPLMMVSSVRSADHLRQRDQRWLSTVARVKPGVTLAQAQTEMDAIMSRLERAYPDANRNRGARVTLLHERFFGGLQLTLWILLGAVGCVLLVACANVANLQLQRAAGRASEMAVRLALGATPRKLVRQLLTESLLLALIGGALGVLLALWSLDFLVKLSPVTFPSFVKLTLNARALGFSLLISVLTGAMFGLAPAMQAARPVLNETLKAGGRNASGGLWRNRLLSSLVVSEIALSLTLLIGAGLMIRSLQRLQAVDPGFNSERLLTMWVSLPAQRYRRDQLAAFSQQLRERLQALPGAQSVALASDLPLSGSTSAGPIELEGLPAESAAGEIRMYRHRVTPGFFSTLGIPLIKGRDFNEADHAQAPGTVIISESLARRYWPNENPIGKRLREAGPENPWVSIVGVAGEVKYRGLPQNPNADPDVYFPLMQRPSGNLNLAIRASVAPDSLVTAARGVLQKLDPDLPAYGVTTMTEQVANQTTQSRFTAWLLSIFGAMALALAAVGVYSVMAYAVEQRSREIGVRVALGARGADVLKMVLGQGMRLALMGVALGLGAALALTQLIKRLLFGVAATDPLIYGALALLLTLVALFACWIPARRATKVDPMIALRCE
ncbi:MAG TPA: ABC transporter permease [Blastocatellia bacterium]|nr:ABC transporter permease [Blastocatellia bacterium]